MVDRDEDLEKEEEEWHRKRDEVVTKLYSIQDNTERYIYKMENYFILYGLSPKQRVSFFQRLEKWQP